MGMGARTLPVLYGPIIKCMKFDNRVSLEPGGAPYGPSAISASSTGLVSNFAAFGAAKNWGWRLTIKDVKPGKPDFGTDGIWEWRDTSK